MRETLGAMKAAQRLAGTPNLAVRNERLSRIAAMVRTYQEEIVAAVDEDFGGRAREETLLAEILLRCRPCIMPAKIYVAGCDPSAGHWIWLSGQPEQNCYRNPWALWG